MRKPLNVTECIQFSNSLIDKSVIQKELVDLKIQVFGKNFREEGSDRAGKKWWRNFVHRHRVQLDKGKAVRFNMKRNEWCKQENLLAMYNNKLIA
jgi:hypothetical protein